MLNPRGHAPAVRTYPPAAPTHDPDQVRALLTRYLRLVAGEFMRSGYTVDGAELAAGVSLAARLRLVGDGARPWSGVDLDWSEEIGWSLALDAGGGPGPRQYLHYELAPAPGMVVTFSRVLVQGDRMGQPFPERFRLAGDPLDGLVASLVRHARLDPQAYVDEKPAVPFVPEQRG